MREALLKKRYGVPAALLILLVLAGVAAAFVVATFTYEITTHEPLTFAKSDGLEITHQGESDDIIVTASNRSTKQGYGIFVDADVVDSRVDSITYGPDGKVISTEQDESKDVNGDGDLYDAKYNIVAGGSYDIVVTVDSADDVAPGVLKVTLGFQREAKYV